MFEIKMSEISIKNWKELQIYLILVEVMCAPQNMPKKYFRLEWTFSIQHSYGVDVFKEVSLILFQVFIIS